MADIKLIKPQAGERITMQSAPDARLEFAFSTADAVVEKSGNDLVFTFDDGSSIVLSEFYTAYTKESLPEFVVEGQTIDGADFFAALGNNDLMPAAGPAATRADAGGRFREYEEAGLLSGIDRLDGLDLPWQQEAFQAEELVAAPFIPNLDSGAEIPNAAPVLDITSPDVLNVKEAGVQQGGNEGEAGTSTVSGKINATDPEGDALIFFIDANGNRVNSLTTEYGTITIDNDGNYIYRLNNEGAANSLAFGENFRENFTVGVQDSNGNVTNERVDVVINIAGTNDRPTLELSVPTLTVNEDGGVSGTVDGGKAEGDDADNKADLTYSFVDADGKPLGNALTDADGTFTIDPKTGEYSYTLTNDSADVQALGVGEHITKTFTIRVQDEHGAWSNQQVTVTINGTNDVPTVDVENSQLAVEVTEEGVQQGGNDPYAGQPTATGTIAAKDADANDTLTYTLGDVPIVDGKQTITTEFGELVLDTTNGEYTYTMSQEANNGLNVGQKNTDTITVTISDGKGGTIEQNITVTIKGTNDQPTLTVTDAALTVNAGTEQNFDKGEAHGEDVDKDDSKDFSIDVSGNTQGTTGTGVVNGVPTEIITTDHGTLHIDPATGKYIYELNSDSDAVKALANGETREETFTITVTDEHGAHDTKDITVTITGGNDNPEITTSGKDTLNLKESGVGTKEEGGDGWGSTEFNHKIDGKLEDESSFTVKDVDNNDKLTASITDSDGNPMDGVVTDVNGVMTLVTEYGTLTVTPQSNADGSITYTYKYDLTDDAVNHLEKNDRRELNFEIKVEDGLGASVSQPVNVVIKGTNDAPEITFEKLHVKESGVYEGNTTTTATGGADGYIFPKNHRIEVEGTLKDNASDVDDGASLTFGISIEGGSKNLYKGQDTTDFVLGENGEPVSVDIIVESSTPGKNELGQITQTIVTNYGTFTLNTVTGDYTFELNEAVANTLGQGQKLDITFKSTVTDEHNAQGTHEVGVTVEGTNDRPTLDVTEKILEVRDDGTDKSSGIFTATGTAKGTDEDINAELTYSFGKDKNGDPITSIKDEYGILTINPETGVYTYKLDGSSLAVQKLTGRGDEVRQPHTVIVTDEHGANSEKEITIVINGANDAPKFVAGNSIKVTESGVKLGGNEIENGKNYGENKMNATDLDNGSELTYSITNADASPVGEDGIQKLETDYGYFTLNTKTGDYTFTLYNDVDAVQSLKPGQHLNLKLNLKVEDGLGGSATTWVQAEITGTNDVPFVALDQEDSWKNAVVEDAGVDQYIPEGGGEGGKDKDITISGKVEASDHEGDKLTYNLVEKEGGPAQRTIAATVKDADGKEHEVGYITMQPDGSYTYTLFNDNPFVQAMRASDSYELSFKVCITDIHGAKTYKDLVITIKGTDDAPTVSGGTGDVFEDGGAVTPVEPPKSLIVEGKASVTDPDNTEASYVQYSGPRGENGELLASYVGGDGKTYDITYEWNGDKLVSTTFEGQHGSLVLNADGTYTYTLSSDANKDMQGKAEDELFGSENFPITGTTGTDKPENDSSAGGNISIEIKGTNDAPEISIDGSKQVIKTDVNTDHVTETGQIKATDIDSDDALDSDKEGSTLTFSVMNKYGKDNNDLTEDNFNDVTGKEKPSEDGSHFEAEQTAIGKYGSLTINPDGTYSYTLKMFDQAVLEYKGETFTETFRVTVTDSHGATNTQDMTITIKNPHFGEGGSGGSGQPPLTDLTCTITSEPLKLTEDGAKLTAEGEAKAFNEDGTEVTEGDVFFAFKTADGYVQSISDKYGSITIDPYTGKYTYTLNNASGYVQELPAGHRIETGFEIHLVDANGKPVLNSSSKDPVVSETGTIVIEGANDAPEFDRIDSITVTETGGITDSDNTAIAKDDDSAIDSNANLIHGQEQGLTYTFYYNGNVINAGASVDTNYGTFTLNKDGTYSYTVDSNNAAVNALGKDVILKDEGIKVTVSDGTADVTKPIDITIKGTNDVPTLTITDELREITEDDSANTNMNITGTIKGHDDDTVDVLTYGVASGEVTANGSFSPHIATGTYGTMVLNSSTGEYEYKLDNERDTVQTLGFGETRTETFTFRVSDGKGGFATDSITITIKGTNDAAEVTMDKTILDMKEAAGVGGNNTPTKFGQIEITDKDTNDTHKLSVSFGENESGEVQYKGNGEAVTVAGNYGILTINADGTYSYQLTSDALGKGEKDQETFTIFVHEYAANGEKVNSTPKEITVKITGSNDKPEIVVGESDLTQTVSEDAAPITGIIVADDVDTGDKEKLTYSIEGEAKGDYGSITIDATGKYTYTLNEHAQTLGEGEDGKDTFTVRVSDGHGGFVDQKITINITGSNDAPVVNVAASNINNVEIVPTEDGIHFQASGKLEVSDAEKDNLTYDIADDKQPTFGTVEIDQEGNYTYKLNDNYQPKADGEKDSFTVTIDDGNGGKITQEITIDLGNTDTLHKLMQGMSNEQLDAFAANKENGNVVPGSEKLTGTEDSDMLFGGTGDNVLFGDEGDDVLFGLGGDDVLYGGDGDDILLGGSGNDYLSGGAGNDKLFGGDGNDLMAFDPRDLFDGGAGNDMLVGDANSMDDMLAGLENGDITNVETLVAGEGLTNLTDMAAMAKELGITLKEDGSVDTASLSGAGFTQGATHNVNGQEFVEYTHGDSPDDKMTLLVAQTIVENGNA